jgi:predicted SnoaL-like aldol condensation-catalyzing enzyme
MLVVLARKNLMSEGNKALVRQWLEEVLTRGNLKRAEDLFARNYVLHDPSFPRDVYGPEGVK